MTPEIRRAALRAAAKAALVISVGCSGGGNSAPPPSNTTPESPAVAASCAEHLDGLAVVPVAQLAPDDPLRGRMDVYGDVFADVAARQSARTQECCTEALATDGSSAAHRWECCSALGDGADAMACTPWGPPCPPRMA